ncbi:hypothetical protein HMPREF9120_00687 [Neisseria sp. oral taxon 020 str. F0370]|nr:hypothetical protein HMPREF9120_00687 [Neisseria sp. oral taxon 020 str. F0370]
MAAGGRLKARFALQMIIYANFMAVCYNPPPQILIFVYVQTGFPVCFD